MVQRLESADHTPIVCEIILGELWALTDPNNIKYIVQNVCFKGKKHLFMLSYFQNKNTKKRDFVAIRTWDQLSLSTNCRSRRYLTKSNQCFAIKINGNP